MDGRFEPVLAKRLSQAMSAGHSLIIPAGRRKQACGSGFLSVEFLNWASNNATRNTADGGFFLDRWSGFVVHGICAEAALPYRRKYDAGLRPGPRDGGESPRQSGNHALEGIGRPVRPASVQNGFCVRPPEC